MTNLQQVRQRNVLEMIFVDLQRTCWKCEGTSSPTSCIPATEEITHGYNAAYHHIRGYNAAYHHIRGYNAAYHHTRGYNAAYHHTHGYNAAYHHTRGYNAAYHHTRGYTAAYHHTHNRMITTGVLYSCVARGIPGLKK